MPFSVFTSEVCNTYGVMVCSANLIRNFSKETVV